MATTATVSLYHPDGQLAEEGPATLGPEDTSWIYTARQPIASWQSLKAVVQTTDTPGNHSVKEVWLNEIL